jgi:hypothetical protein
VRKLSKIRILCVVVTAIMAFVATGSAAADAPSRPRSQASRRTSVPRVKKSSQGVATPARRPITTKRTNPGRPPVAIPASEPAVVIGAY